MLNQLLDDINSIAWPTVLSCIGTLIGFGLAERIKTYAGAIHYIWRLGIGPRYMDDIGCFPNGPNWHRAILWFWFNRPPVVDKENNRKVKKICKHKWDIIRTIWPHADGWGTYCTKCRMVMDTGLAKEQAEIACRKLSARKRRRQ